MSLRCQRDLCVVMSTLLLSWGCSTREPWIEALNNRWTVSVLEAASGDLRAVRETFPLKLPYVFSLSSLYKSVSASRFPL